MRIEVAVTRTFDRRKDLTPKCRISSKKTSAYIFSPPPPDRVFFVFSIVSHPASSQAQTAVKITIVLKSTWSKKISHVWEIAGGRPRYIMVYDVEPPLDIFLFKSPATKRRNFSWIALLLYYNGMNQWKYHGTLKDWSALDAYGVSLGTPGPSRLKRQLLFVMWNVKHIPRRIFSQNIWWRLFFRISPKK